MFRVFNFMRMAMSVIMCFSYCLSYAESVDFMGALNVAKNFMKNSFKKDKIENFVTFRSDSIMTMYAFNFESGGFVLVSASDNSDPILAYSNSGFFQSKDSIANDGILHFLDDCETVILGREKKIRMPGLRSESEFYESKAKWKDLSDVHVPSYGAATSGIEIAGVPNLLYDSLRGGAVRWNQYGCEGEISSYDINLGTWSVSNNPNKISYNAMMPSVEGECEHAIAGCGSVAIAQVLWKWKYPESVNFTYKGEVYNSVYNWDSMPVRLNVESSIENMNEISTLIRDCAFMLGSNIGCLSTISGIRNIERYLVGNDWIGYNCYGEIYTEEYSGRSWDHFTYSVSEWTDILVTELIAGRPVITSSTVEFSTGGHSSHIYIITGFEKRADGPYFRTNFGWGGEYDDVLYNLDFSETATQYSEMLFQAGNKRAIIGLSPKRGNEDGTHSIYGRCQQATISEFGVGKLSFYVENANSYLLTIKYKGKEKIYYSTDKFYYEDRDFIIKKRIDNVFSDGIIELWYSSNASLENEIETESGKAFAPTTYELTFFNNYGEIVTYTGTFEKESLSSDFMVKKEVDFIIYPNPSSKNLTIIANSEINSLIITNINGARVYDLTGQESLRWDLDLSSIPSGVYSITINTSKGQNVKQIILK